MDPNYIMQQLATYGMLSLHDLVALTIEPKIVEGLEQFFKLSLSGNINTFLNNYRHLHYTKQCLVYLNSEFCFTEAAKSGDREIVNRALTDLADNNSQSDYLDMEFEDIIYYAIRGAIKNSHSEIVKLLLNRATDLNVIIHYSGLIGYALNIDEQEIADVIYDHEDVRIRRDLKSITQQNQ